MGIPHLTRDVAPFAVSISLRAQTQDKTADVVDKVVIDGPSLVYHAYYLVLKYQASHRASSNPDSTTTGARAHPPYSIINDVVVRFLRDLRSVGVTILRIYFDGALPLTKKSTRRQRLEQSRRQLEKCRQTYPMQPPVEVDISVAAEKDLSSILWKTRACVSSSSPLPPAPFMVPAAIERLVSTLDWANLVEIVPGESDAYCAALAAKEAAGILSNDSDLLLHDLGEHASVVGFHSLELEENMENPTTLRGLCLKPQDVARGLGVDDLKEYGFQRYLDRQATSRRISERTRMLRHTSTSNQHSYQEFQAEFSTAAIITDSEIIPSLTLYGLDPRISELVCAFATQRSLDIYFPILCEDQNRDSAWLYGAEIRQLAYSVYAHFRNPSVASEPDLVVVEHLRKGKTVREFPIQCFSYALLEQKVDEFISLHQKFLDDAYLSHHHLTFHYHALAACLIQIQKKKQSKSSLFEISNLLARDSDAKLQPSWDDVHILASLHAVLYSIRLFKQFLGLILEPLKPADELQAQLGHIRDMLKPLPAIEQLIFNPTELSLELQTIPVTSRFEALKTVEMISNYYDQPEMEEKFPHRPHQLSSSNAETAMFDTDSTFFEKSSKKSKGRRNLGNDGEARNDNRSERSIDSQVQSYLSNPFALLDGR